MSVVYVVVFIVEIKDKHFTLIYKITCLNTHRVCAVDCDTGGLRFVAIVVRQLHPEGLPAERGGIGCSGRGGGTRRSCRWGCRGG